MYGLVSVLVLSISPSFHFSLISQTCDDADGILSPGRIYQPGPGESLQNFEVHLKNRVHIANRQARETKAGVV